MKNLITYIILAFFVIACKQEKPLPEGYMKLTGLVKGITDGKFLLRNYPEVDTIIVSNGIFEIEKELKKKVQRFDITPLDQNSRERVTIYLEQNKHQIEFDAESFEIIKLLGSKTHDESEILSNQEKEIESKYKVKLDAFKKNIAKIMEAREMKLGDKVYDSLKGVDNDFRQIHLAPFYKERDEAILDFITNNPNSFISYERFPFVLNDLSYDEAMVIYNNFPQDFKVLKNSKRLLKDIENKKIGVSGALAGNFNTTDINGKPIKLNDFKGKYLLIDFWASWCVPCRKGNPHLISLFQKYNPKGLEILGVSDNDGDEKSWIKAVNKDQIGIWHHVLRGRSRTNAGATDISSKYNVHSLPTKVLVGPDGVIIGRYGDQLGGTDEDMDNKLKEIFGF